MPATIPLLLISGFLGAGKTTLVNRILAGNHGQRLAVLVNDFGAINVDQRLIETADGESMRLSNGCICCSIGSDLMETLIRLLGRPDPPDRLIVEASGVADPLRVGAIGLFGDAFRLEGIVTMVDAETVRERAADARIGATVLRQIEAADILILNKADLVTAETLGDRGAWLSSISDAPVIVTTNAQVADTLLADLPPPAMPRTGTAAGHTDDVASFMWTADKAVNRAALEGVAATIARTAWRAKGFVRLTEGSDALHLLQVVGRRWSLSSAPPGALPGLVVIGPREGLNADAVLAALEAAAQGQEQAPGHPPVMLSP